MSLLTPDAQSAYDSRVRGINLRNNALQQRIGFERTELKTDQGRAGAEFERDWGRKAEGLAGGYVRGGTWNSGIRQQGYRQFETDRFWARDNMNRGFNRQFNEFSRREADGSLGYQANLADAESEKYARQAQLGAFLSNVAPT